MRLIAKTATAMTRALLLAYPAAFRRDVGNALTADVARRAQELRGPRAAAWLVRLCASLLINAVAAWGERVGTRRLRSSAPIGTLISWIDLKLACRMLAKSPGLTALGGRRGARAGTARPPDRTGRSAEERVSFTVTIPLQAGARAGVAFIWCDPINVHNKEA